MIMVLFTFRYSGILISDLLFPAETFFFQALTSGGRSERRYFKCMHAVLTSTTDDRLPGPGTASHMFSALHPQTDRGMYLAGDAHLKGDQLPSKTFSCKPDFILIRWRGKCEIYKIHNVKQERNLQAKR
jgi:hypothetical protein